LAADGAECPVEVADPIAIGGAKQELTDNNTIAIRTEDD